MGTQGEGPFIAVTRPESGALQWTFGNDAFRQRLVLDADGFRCTSLLNWRTEREWIHPTAVSDELLIAIATPGDEKTILTGRSPWAYANHTAGQVDARWFELQITLKSKQHPVTVTRVYRWHVSHPLVRQWTLVLNPGPEHFVVYQVDTFRLRVAGTLDDLDLAWMNNYPRGMKPARGDPIHYRSIGENVEHFIRSGPYSPHAGWFCLTIPHRGEGLVGGWEWSGSMAVGFGDHTDPALIKGYVQDELVSHNELLGDLTSPCLIHGGLDPAGMNETLARGASFQAPVGWYGFFEGDLDEAAALAQDLVRTTLGPPLPKQDFPWVGYCTWAPAMDGEKSPYNEKGTHPWFPTEQNLLSQVEAAAELGCELFIWDYGWFPRVGDWWIDKTRFPNGPRTVADAVHARGMKLGLWVGFGCANEESKVVREHRDWLAEYKGQPWSENFPQITGASMWGERALCLGHRPVIEWVKERLSHVIEEFQIDWLKHDFDVVTLCDSAGHTHTPGHGRIATCEGFYEIMDHVRRKYPHVVCENWMNSTGVPDFGVLQRHQIQLIGDAYKPFLLRQMFYGHSQIFPADRQHRYLRLDRSKADLRYMIRSVSMGGPWTLLEDPRLMTDEQKWIVREEISRYKRLRHLFRTGKVYRLIRRPHIRGWDATEFWDDRKGEGVVYVFRNRSDQTEHPVVLKGLQKDGSYELSFVDGHTTQSLGGLTLLTEGFRVRLPEQMRSALVMVRRDREREREGERSE